EQGSRTGIQWPPSKRDKNSGWLLSGSVTSAEAVVTVTVNESSHLGINPADTQRGATRAICFLRTESRSAGRLTNTYAALLLLPRPIKQEKGNELQNHSNNHHHRRSLSERTHGESCRQSAGSGRARAASRSHRDNFEFERPAETAGS